MVQKKESELTMKLRRMTFLMFVIFRFAFAMTPAIFYEHPEFQIMFLVFSNLFFTCYDIGVEAESVEHGLIKKIHLVNKFLNHCLYLGLLCFTDFVADKEL